MIPIPHRLALNVQFYIARLEALHEAPLGLRCRAGFAGKACHLQSRGGGRAVTLVFFAGDDPGPPTESNRTRRLVLRRFPKAKPTRVRGSSPMVHEWRS